MHLSHLWHWMLFCCWIDRIKRFRRIFLICKDISLICWIKLLLLHKNTAKIITREVITSTSSPFIFNYGALIAIWILWISGLDCRLNFTVKTVVMFNWLKSQKVEFDRPGEQQQQSYSGLRSPGWSNSTFLNDFWVQTFHSGKSLFVNKS